MTHYEAAGAPASRGAASLLIPSAAVAACLAVILWLGCEWRVLRARDTYAGKKADYYSLLVHGFLKGHTYMDTVPDPALESPDKGVRESAAYLLDASYYHRRYYMYFGVTPAALVLLPYAWLTGGDLDSRLLVVLATMAGFLFSLALLRRAARDHFGRLGTRFSLVAIPVLAFATVTPCLLPRAMFYEVAIASGYALTMAGAFWIYLALFGRGAPWLSLALASLCMGLAVGCRPDLVLDLPALAAAAFLAAWWRRGETAWPAGLLRAGAAALIPAALVGAGLALYNYERFGNPLDFGIGYSMNDFIGHHRRLSSVAYVWPNLRWYYLTPPALSPFFPYVFPEQAYFGPPGYPSGEAIHGQLPVTLFAACAILPALALWRRLRLGRLAAYLALLGWMFAAAFAALCSMGVRADRYMVDFQPALVLAALLLAGALASRAAGGFAPALWRAAFGLAAAAAVAFNLLGGLQEFSFIKNTRAEAYARMERLGNFPSYWLERLGMLPAGPVELKVVFPGNFKGAWIEPILTAGTPEISDSLYVTEWSPGGRIQISGEHHGYGGPSSAVMTVNPGQVYTLKVDMGALYPPLHHPFFDRYIPSEAHLMKSRLRVEMDGKTIIDRKMGSYDAPPGSLEIGRNDLSMTPFRAAFSGRAELVRRLPPPVPVAATQSNGLWRIRCVLPLDSPNTSHPLLSYGVTGAGTLVFLNVLPENKVRFGLDEWGAGGSFSGSVVPAALEDHLIEIFIGPLASKAAWPADWNLAAGALGSQGSLLKVWLDGRLAWSTELHLPFSPSVALFDVGTNRQGFSTAPGEYSSEILSMPYSQAEAREFLERNLGAKP